MKTFFRSSGSSNETALSINSCDKPDYAAPIWLQIAGGGATHRMINSVQRVGSQAITGAFKTTATAVIESEAGLPPAAHRLQSRVMQYVVNLHTSEKNHPWWPVHRRAQQYSRRFQSPMSRLLQHFQPVLQGDSKAKIENIKAFMHPPNQPTICINFC